MLSERQLAVSRQIRIPLLNDPNEATTQIKQFFSVGAVRQRELAPAGGLNLLHSLAQHVASRICPDRLADQLILRCKARGWSREDYCCSSAEDFTKKAAPPGWTGAVVQGPSGAATYRYRHSCPQRKSPPIVFITFSDTCDEGEYAVYLRNITDLSITLLKGLHWAHLRGNSFRKCPMIRNRMRPISPQNCSA